MDCQYGSLFRSPPYQPQSPVNRSGQIQNFEKTGGGVRLDFSLAFRKNINKGVNDFVVSQQTRDIEPLLDQCWASVVDGGPTLNQQRLNISLLLSGYVGFDAPPVNFKC